MPKCQDYKKTINRIRKRKAFFEEGSTHNSEVQKTLQEQFKCGKYYVTIDTFIVETEKQKADVKSLRHI